MRNIRLFIKGFIIGIGKITPGVSGAVLAISLGVYEDLLDFISKLPKIDKKNLKKVLIILIGIITAISISSKLIIWLLNKYSFIVILLFIGLILGSIHNFIKEVSNDINLRNIIIFLLVVSLILSLSLINIKKEIEININLNSFLYLFSSGYLDALSSIIPGISGTALLMMIGTYETIINSLGNILNITIINYNLFILIPFMLGFIIGIIMISKIMNYILKKHKAKFNFIIIGLSISSIIVLLLNSIKEFNIFQLLIGLLLFILGYLFSFKLDS